MLRVDHARFRLLEAPISGFSGGTYTVGARAAVQCRLSTNEGHSSDIIVGNESSYSKLFWSLLSDQFQATVKRHGLFEYEAIWAELCSFADAAYLDKQEIVKAISTMDIALWDLRAQALEMPLNALLGGYTDRRPAVGIGGYYETSTDKHGITEEVARYNELGLAGIKFKVGSLPIDREVERVEWLRDAAGPDFIIVVDSNMAWDPLDARRFASAITEFNIAWLEEPIHWRNEKRGLHQVRSSGVPIAAGQSEISVFNAYELLSQNSVDVLNVTANRGGGVTGWRKIANAAAFVDVRMANVAEPHISLHTMSAIPNGTFVECYPDETRDPIWHTIYGEKPAVVEGQMVIPDRPGLGLVIDQDIANSLASSDWS